jgi:hypothetical protein
MQRRDFTTGVKPKGASRGRLSRARCWPDGWAGRLLRRMHSLDELLRGHDRGLRGQNLSGEHPLGVETVSSSDASLLTCYRHYPARPHFGFSQVLPSP